MVVEGGSLSIMVGGLLSCFSFLNTQSFNDPQKGEGSTVHKIAMLLLLSFLSLHSFGWVSIFANNFEFLERCNISWDLKEEMKAMLNKHISVVFIIWMCFCSNICLCYKNEDLLLIVRKMAHACIYFQHRCCHEFLQCFHV